MDTTRSQPQLSCSQFYFIFIFFVCSDASFSPFPFPPHLFFCFALLYTHSNYLLFHLLLVEKALVFKHLFYFVLTILDDRAADGLFSFFFEDHVCGQHRFTSLASCR